jgi:hypothetical protein
VLSVSYASWPYGSSFMADSVYADWGGTPIVNRVYGTPGQATNAPNMLLNPFPSIFSDSGTPRSRLSYHVGVCSPECDNGGIGNITWGPWFHPYVPAQVTGTAPTLTATSPTRASPGIKITINPGDQAGAPMYLLYNTGAPVARIPADDLTYVDTDPYRPKNSYQVQACYADCNRPTWPFGDGYRPTSALSTPVVAWAADTITCKLLGPSYYSAGLDWHSVCKP